MSKNNKFSKSVFSSFDDLSKKLNLNSVIEPVKQKENSSFNSPSKYKKADVNDVKNIPKSKNIRIKEEQSRPKNIPREREVVKFDQNLFYELKVKARETQRNKSYSIALNLYTKAVDLALEFIKKSRALGEKKNENGDVDGALKEYKEANKVFKKLSPIIYNRGVILQKMKDFSGAIEDYSFVVKYHPNHKASYIKRVEIRERLGEFDLVIEDLQEIIKLDINNRSFYYKLAGIYLVKGDFAEAIKDYKNALSKDPRNPDKILTKAVNFIAKGKIKLALKELDFVLVRLEKIINKFRSSQFDKKISEVEFVKKLNIPLYNLYSTRADILRKNGMYDKSESDYSNAIHFSPNHDNILYLNRAFVRVCLNKLEEAIKDYTCVVDHDDKNIKTYIARGDCYLQQKKYDKASKDFEKVLSLEPFNIPIYKKLGDVKFDQGDYKGAEVDFDHVLDFNKKDQKLFLKKALIKVYNNDKKGFISVLKLALASNPLTSVTMYKEAKKLLNNKKIKKSSKIINSFILANQEFLDLVLAFPDILTFFAVKDELILKDRLINNLNIKYFDALLLKVEISKELHDYKKMLLDLKNILSHDNSNYEALKHMAEFYLLDNDYKKALTYIKKCFNLEKHSDADLFFFRANVYEGLNDFENAVKDYQKAIKLNHRNYIYHTRLGITAFQNNMFEVSIYALKQSLEIEKNQHLPCTFMALICLTSTDESLRNITQGFNYAKTALQLNKCIENYEIMAVAYSLKNMFDKACEMQEKALKLSVSDRGKQLLKLYQDNKPWIRAI